MQKDKFSPELSIVIPVFVENPTRVKAVQERIESFRILCEIYGGAELIIVDDGSCQEMLDWYPENTDIMKTFMIPRAGDWTQPRARNLGMQAAIGRKILLIDVDHVVPPLTFAFLLKCDPALNEVYKFKRIVFGEDEPTTPHPCTLLFHNRELYFHEQFCGNYGSDDKCFLEYHKLKPIVSDYYVLVDDQGPTHGLSRATLHNKSIMDRYRKKGFPKPEVTKLEDVYEKDSSISTNEQLQ